MDITSRTVAKQMLEIAEFLNSRPEFELDYSHPGIFTFFSKDKFTAAAKAIGSATKSYGEGEYAYFKLSSTLSPVVLSIQRDAVCRKITKYECEPLFTTEEVENL